MEFRQLVDFCLPRKALNETWSGVMKIRRLQACLMVRVLNGMYKVMIYPRAVCVLAHSVSHSRIPQCQLRGCSIRSLVVLRVQTT